MYIYFFGLGRFSIFFRQFNPFFDRIINYETFFQVQKILRKNWPSYDFSNLTGIGPLTETGRNPNLTVETLEPPALRNFFFEGLGPLGPRKKIKVLEINNSVICSFRNKRNLKKSFELLFFSIEKKIQKVTLKKIGSFFFLEKMAKPKKM